MKPVFVNKPTPEQSLRAISSKQLCAHLYAAGYLKTSLEAPPLQLAARSGVEVCLKTLVGCPPVEDDDEDGYGDGMMMVIANIAAMMIATDDSITNEHLDGVAGKCQRPAHLCTAVPLEELLQMEL
ncbi:uncharacterized protein LOC117138179 [Drosophila mauritiana]|uniref:Uncharacterized protein LOC117138179 n=1 Tax=Drosophila mauritiana TaxID=7226 RepID=A0A6P8JJG1_DROMA|nr:uncharacterized protein LOC117138179 [Drosophila mauritiana]